MKPWTIGLSTGCFYNRPIFDVLHEVRESGFDVIEVCSFPAHLDYHNRADVERAGGMLRSLGIRPASFHAPFAVRNRQHAPAPASDPLAPFGIEARWGALGVDVVGA